MQPSHRRRSRPRIRICSYNVGGLCTASHDVLANWLQKEGRNFDVIMLQETHYGLGRTPTEFSLPGWSVISSPDPKHKCSGVAILVSAAIAAPDSLGHAAIMRLLHVRAPCGQDKHTRHIDLVCCYQWSWSHKASKNRLALRQEVWTALTNHVLSLPARNVNCISGDFNCTLRPKDRCVGQCLSPDTSRRPDTAEFCHFVEVTGLCALNTWSRTMRRGTFVQAGKHAGRSHIDYIFASVDAADGQARQSTIDPQINFAPWRGGDKHFAVTASLKLASRLHFCSPQDKPAYSRASLRDAQRANAPAYQLSRADIDQQLQVQQVSSTSELNQLVLASCAQHFPPASVAKPQRAWNTDEVQITVKRMSQAYGALNTSRATLKDQFTTKTMFEVFRRHTASCKTQKLLCRKGRDKRKQIFLGIMQKAESAATRGDIHVLYKCIRDLAPKVQFARVQINGNRGQMLTPHEEYEAIKGYFTQVFQRHGPKPNQTHTLQQPCVILSTEVHAALRRQKGGKAVPPDLTASLLKFTGIWQTF